MNKKKYKKEMQKKILISLIIFFSIYTLFGLYIKLNNKTYNKLESIGYSNKEISIIEDLLDKNSIKIIYKYPYIPCLTSIVFDKDFKNKNLSNYLNYYTKYPNINNTKLLFMVNNGLENIPYSKFVEELILHKDFKKKDIERYYNYYNKYKLSTDDTVYAVNYNLDKYNIKLNKDDKKYIEANYFIPNYLQRYKKYAKDNKDLKTQKVIESVNNNLDKEPYKDVKYTNINNGILTIVNQYYHLRKNYIPDNLINIDKKYGNGKLQEEAYEAYKIMYDEAYNNKLRLSIISGYISYQDQSDLYYKYANRYGNHYADSLYERPGYSENQLGLSITLSIEKEPNPNKFHIYEEANWMKENAYKYGFILRYPTNKKEFTGYIREYQYRYVGKEAAKIIQEDKITFDEYYEYYIKQKES